MSNKIEIQTKHFTFDGYQEGDPNNPLVLLLHGFPEGAHMWLRLMNEVSSLGYYCVAPNLRGYSKKACPAGKENYRIDLLVADVMDLANALNKNKFHLIGHDWGSAIGWQLVHDYPDCAFTWSALSVPHLQAFGNAIANDPSQRKMSRYMRSFQWPWLPERRLRKGDLAALKRLWKRSDPKEVEAYLQIFRHRPSLKAALNYYRANYKILTRAGTHQILGPIKVPTLFIWGERDMAVGDKSVEESHKFMSGPYEFLALKAGHWLIQTNYPEVSEAIIRHIKNSMN